MADNVSKQAVQERKKEVAHKYIRCTSIEFIRNEIIDN